MEVHDENEAGKRTRPRFNMRMTKEDRKSCESCLFICSFFHSWCSFRQSQLLYCLLAFQTRGCSTHARCASARIAARKAVLLPPSQILITLPLFFPMLHHIQPKVLRPTKDCLNELVGGSSSLTTTHCQVPWRMME